MVIQYRQALYIGSYLLLFIVLFLNLHHRSLWLILLGAIGNFAAIVLNQGSMPIDLALLEQSGFVNMYNSITTGNLVNYIPLEQAQWITAYLGKRIVTPDFYPLKQILSIGDILISLGLLVYVQGAMNDRLHRRTAGMLQFDHKKGFRR